MTSTSKIYEDSAEAKQLLRELMEDFKSADLGYLNHSGIGSYHAFGEGNDMDFVVLVDDGHAALDVLLELDFTRSENSDYDDFNDDFVAIRRGKVNLMVTPSQQFYDDSVKAFLVCKVLKLHNKGDRIRVHQLVVDSRPEGSLYVG
jgi:hypothetical protein